MSWLKTVGAEAKNNEEKSSNVSSKYLDISNDIQRLSSPCRARLRATKKKPDNVDDKFAGAATVQQIVMRVAVCDKPDILFDNRAAE
jgi:hypothetical protein